MPRKIVVYSVDVVAVVATSKRVVRWVGNETLPLVVVVVEPW